MAVETHMSIPWHDYVISEDDVPAAKSSLSEKASVIGRIGMLMLSCGTPAWRVRNSMNTAAAALGVSCTADIGAVSLNFTCIDVMEHCTQSISLPGLTINTYKLYGTERFIRDFPEKCGSLSIEGIHDILDSISKTPETHSTLMISFAAAAACAAFAFLLGAGIYEIICVFFGAFTGQLIRKIILNREYSLFISIGAAAAAACAVYALVMLLLRLALNIPADNGAGYICSVLFLVPGFPFITSLLDLAKLDLRAGLERLMYSGIVMFVAMAFAWVASLIFGYESESLAGLKLPFALLIILRLLASFVGIYGFSMLFNSTHKMALAAALVGTVPNVIRLELVQLLDLPVTVAAFIGAFLAGIIAIIAVKKSGFPRVSITIPSVLVSVPGFFMYQSIYYFGTDDADNGVNALVKAIGIIFAISLGILFSRFIADKRFRHRD